MEQDNRLHDSLSKQVRQFEIGKIAIKSYTKLGLPYLFKRNNVAGKAWTPAMPNTFVGIDNEWIEDGMTSEQECVLWLDHCFSKQHPVGYYGA